MASRILALVVDLFMPSEEELEKIIADGLADWKARFPDWY